MQVDKPTDRAEMPEECDCCGCPVQLERYSSYGPGFQVEWLCPYCAESHNQNDVMSKTMAAMFNRLEIRILEKLEKKNEMSCM